MARVRHQRHGLLERRIGSDVLQTRRGQAGNNPSTRLGSVFGQAAHDVLFGNDPHRGIVFHHHQRSNLVRAHLVCGAADRVFNIDGDDCIFLRSQQFSDVHSCFLLQATD
ncbi:hypothetical protein D9M71_736480 [compost metagenome]